MAQLLVRKIEASLVTKLRQKAAAEGISMEEEHRRILRQVLLGEKSPPKKSFKEHLRSAPVWLTEAELSRPRDKPRKIDF